MKKLMNILMLSCKKSSELIEKEMFSGLTLIERIRLSMHTSVCDACKGWKKQSKQMDGLLHGHIDGNGQDSGIIDNELSDKARQRIIRKLENNK